MGKPEPTLCCSGGCETSASVQVLIWIPRRGRKVGICLGMKSGSGIPFCAYHSMMFDVAEFLRSSAGAAKLRALGADLAGAKSLAKPI